MKPSDSQSVEEAKAVFVREFHRQQIRSALKLAFLIGIAYVLYRFCPRPWNGAVLAVAPAVYMTGLLALRPQALRSKTGSLAPAIGLVSFLWCVAIFAAVTTWMASR
jgi:hypothetical protein